VTQPTFDWSRDVSLPVRGQTAHIRHAGATGAQHAAKDRGRVSAAYRDLLRVAGPLSDHEAAQALGRMVSSINSTRHGWGAHVAESAEYERTAFGTRRTKWQWVEQP
jgi:hypothetical protein